MSLTMVPQRRRGAEYLDDRALDPALALRSLADIRRCNALFGGTAAVLAALRPHLARAGRRATSLLDVGTGAGDIPAAARRLADRSGVPLTTYGVEWTVTLAAAAAPAAGAGVTADARRLPFADRSVDFVLCSQVLHHFDDADAIDVVRELHRVARRAVVVGELRRSWAAVAGIWVASWPLAFHAVSRHDGVLSVMRGFLRDELEELIRRATGVSALVRRRPGFRVTADWAVA